MLEHAGAPEDKVGAPKYKNVVVLLIGTRKVPHIETPSSEILGTCTCQCEGSH